MCTAILFRADHRFFGRTLDLESNYGEDIVRIPKERQLYFRHIPTLERHLSILGMALDCPDFPLIFDGMNEAGLAMAGLNFPNSAHYFEKVPEGSIPLASFELIPYILATCKTVKEARRELSSITVLDTPYSSSLPPSPLHWMLTDGDTSLTVEQTEEGLQVYDNPVGILTNEPPFPYHLYNLSNYLHLSPHPQRSAAGIKLDGYSSYSRGMGGIGLPGDNSSASRFVRAAFTAACALPCGNTEEDVVQFFHIAETVTQVKGCVRLDNGGNVHTLYTSCCDLDARRYYVRRYGSFAVSEEAL